MTATDIGRRNIELWLENEYGITTNDAELAGLLDGWRDAIEAQPAPALPVCVVCDQAIVANASDPATHVGCCLSDMAGCSAEPAPALEPVEVEVHQPVGAVLSVRVPGALAVALDEEARQRGVKMSEVIREALDRRHGPWTSATIPAVNVTWAASQPVTEEPRLVRPPDLGDSEMRHGR